MEAASLVDGKNTTLRGHQAVLSEETIRVLREDHVEADLNKLK